MTLAREIEHRPVTFRIRRCFSAPSEQVFRAWTHPGELERWWCPPGWIPAGLQIDLRAGGAFRFGMRKPGAADAVYSHGRFIEVSVPTRLVYTWNWDGAFLDMPETRVTVEFTPRGGGTELTLVHEELPGIGLCLRHYRGWSQAAERLQAAIGG